MSDLLERRQQEELRLNRAIIDQNQKIMSLITKVNNAKAKAQEVLDKMSQALDQAQSELMEYLKELELIREEAGKIVVITRKNT